MELTPSKPNKDNLETDLDLDEFHIDGSEDVLLHGEDVSDGHFPHPAISVILFVG